MAYPEDQITEIFGLSLEGMTSALAENFEIIDSIMGQVQSLNLSLSQGFLDSGTF